MRFLLCLLMLNFVALPVLAQTPGPTATLGPGEVLRGRFKEDHLLKGAQHPVTSEGHFVLAPDYGLIWAIERPIPFTFVVTSAGMTQFLGGIPVFYENPTKAATFIHLVAMAFDVFGGNWAVLDRSFQVARQGEPKSWRIKLTPRPTNEAERLVKQVTAEGKRFVDKAEVLEKSGDSDSFLFFDQQIAAGKPNAAEQNLFDSVHPQ